MGPNLQSLYATLTDVQTAAAQYGGDPPTFAF